MGKFLKMNIIFLILLCLTLFNCSSENTAYEQFGIYLKDGSLILSDTDIEAYVKSEHKLILNQQGMTKWNSFIIYDSTHTPPTPVLSGKLYQNEFSVKLDNDIMYAGKFWSYASSMSYNGIVILDVLLPLDSLHNWISIKNGFAAKPDVRDTTKVIDFFESKGKLR